MLQPTFRQNKLNYSCLQFYWNSIFAILTANKNTLVGTTLVSVYILKSCFLLYLIIIHCFLFIMQSMNEFIIALYNRTIRMRCVPIGKIRYKTTIGVSLNN